MTTRMSLDHDWRFGGEVALPGAEDLLDPARFDEMAAPDFDDSAWATVAVPHTVVPLSWNLWNPTAWERVWSYRKRFDTPGRPHGGRVFVDFGAVMTTALVFLNGRYLGLHRGGYLPFSFEVTDAMADSGENLLAVIVDSRFNINVPPNLPAPALSSTIDYLQPGGIHRTVTLRVEPSELISDVAVTHHDPLDAARRRTSVTVGVDAAAPREGCSVDIALTDGDATIAAVTAPVRLAAGMSSIDLELDALQEVELWDTDNPRLYDLVVTLRSSADEVLHRSSRRTGYREARFEVDGFFLNGRRRYLMGVNRHGYFPFGGFSMSDRVQRRDAQIIKDDLNCVMVRCSHYPQTESFLDACDELGLLVWEESPGWQYVGDGPWQDAAADDIEAMIRRDRHRPSVIVWGARLNETPDRPEFYARTEELVTRLDDSRTTSGTMFGDYARSATFQHELFGYDDYTTAIDDAGERHPVLLDPVPGLPYLVSEGISTRSSPTTLYRRADPAAVQQHQALDYAIAHDAARGDPRFSGLLAWVGFDYQANMGNHHRGIKTSGLGDVFRVLKPGAAIYRSQIDPSRRVVLEPAFTWDPPEFGQANAFGGRPEGRAWTPGASAMICSNCDRVEVFIGQRAVGVVLPDGTRFPNLAFPPSFADLTIGEGDHQDLRLVGYLGDERVVERRFSGDRSGDSISLIADDPEIDADGSDSTRIRIAIVDRFGEARGQSSAVLDLELDGPAELIGDARFDLLETGGVGAVWVRSRRGQSGRIVLRASTREYGSTTAVVTAVYTADSDKETA